MEEYASGLTLTERILAVMAGEWVSGTYVASILGIRKELCVEKLRVAYSRGLVYRRELEDGTHEYRVKDDTRDRIRQTVSTRIRFGQKTRRRKRYAARRSI